MHPIEQLLANNNTTTTDVESNTRLKEGSLQKIIDKDIRTSDISLRILSQIAIFLNTGADIIAKQLSDIEVVNDLVFLIED
ncbi:hypothetical protein ACOC6V_000098 [Listeria monocytogenes]|uniref:Uncharacterized protein n=1 Tax=Listeria monocytogenes TaxID=1639 RepID=A0A2Z5C5G0_LISMN|nr:MULTISPECIES: hypothetical protein [Listeria]EAE1679833.1 hypothetical protein [Listeria monocytogenes LIS0071]EAE3710307.1 hypothetical protein [Listeria monocytogenes serotype 1/2b]EAF3077312.1 hypothetical protein [Listeria monocytogenes serotype 1/2a]EAG6252243.1 hypothetical protein [Listeria monocytogenes CFSAN003806]EAG6261592.1 hypothetical protein [Listeria monocytogenes CFSAN003725]EAG6331283.1 hypothetical protein [Listeria monocytogenes CFSAN002346]EAG6350480.1 hypothetical pr